MNRYISIREVMDNILEHPLLRDVPFERIVNHTVHFIRIVGMPKVFIEKTSLINISEYRGALPCDFNKMIQVRTHGECDHRHGIFRYSTDSFHMSDDKENSFDLTYKIQGGVIFTSMRNGSIEIAYEALAVDPEGYPMIPDNSSFIRALELYIKKYYFNILFDTGKINQAVWNQVCQDYAFAVGQAQSDLIRPTVDQMESMTNMLNTLVSRVTEHKNGFVNLGTKETLKSHG